MVQTFVEVVVIGAMIGSLYGIIAMGFCLIHKTSGIFNLAQGELVMLAGFLLWTAQEVFHLPKGLDVLVVLFLISLLALLVERLAMRRLIGTPFLTPFMMTLGVGMMLLGVISMGWSFSLQYIHLFPEKPIIIGSLNLAQPLVWSFGACLLVLGLLTYFIRHAKIGLLMRAMAEDQQQALSVGISVKSVMRVVWVLGYGLAVLGGITLANVQGVHHNMAAIGLTALPVALLAGIESITGAVFGGMIVGVGQVLAERFIDPITHGGMGTVFPFIIMLVVLIIRPYGLFGLKKIERV